MTTSSTIVAFKDLGLFKNWKDIYSGTIKRKISVRPLFSNDYPTGWFNDATQQNGALSGAGGLIKLSLNSIYKWTICCGPGTNTRAELMGA